METKQLLWKKTQYATIPSTEIPDNIDLTETVKRFSIHKYHLGGWPINESDNIGEQYPPLNEVSHVVRTVTLNENNDLEITFELMHTSRGSLLEELYVKKNPFKMVPVVDKEGINILRFDLIRS